MRITQSMAPSRRFAAALPLAVLCSIAALALSSSTALAAPDAPKAGAPKADAPKADAAKADKADAPKAKADAKPKAAAKSAAPAKAAATKKAKPKGPKVDAKTQQALDQARALLSSGKREEVEAGIQSLGLLGGAAAVPPLEERIREGLPPELLEAAVVTLMALSQPEAGPVLYELSAHRRPDIRLRSIEAITATNPKGAETALVAALSDSDGRVRAAAATGLGELKADGAIEKLFLALDRGNMEASGAIGKVIPPGQVSRLVGYLGTVPLRNLGPALAEVLQRKDVAESAKLEIVARLEEVGTKEVKGYFGDLVASAGEALPQNVSRALLRAMQEIAE